MACFLQRHPAVCIEVHDLSREARLAGLRRGMPDVVPGVQREDGGAVAIASGGRNGA